MSAKKNLHDSGLIFLHCDTSANHYLRLLLDEVFGENLFINEIVWAYKKWSNSSKKLLDGHQTIWVYAKTKNYKFKHIFTSYSPTTNIDQIFYNNVYVIQMVELFINVMKMILSLQQMKNMEYHLEMFGSFLF